MLDWIREIVNRVDEKSRSDTEKAVSRLLASQNIHTYRDLIPVIQNHTIASDLRKTACWIMGQSGQTTGVFALIYLAQDISESKWLRCTAILALGRCGSKKSLKTLREIVHNPDEDLQIRELAIQAMGLIGGQVAFNFLMRILDNPEEIVSMRCEAAEALSLIGDKQAVPHLINAAKDKNPDVRFWCVYALGELRDIRAIAILKTLVDDHSQTEYGTISQEATYYLQQMTERGKI